MTDYWRARLPSFGSPPRASIDPTEILELLPQVFIVGRAAPGRYGFRLVGTLVAQLHGRPLRDSDFLPLWLAPDRASLQSAMEGAARRSHPLVVQAQGRTHRAETVELEILLAPLAGPDGAVTRFLGLYQPLSPLGGRPEAPLDHLTVKRIGVAAGGDIMAEAPRLKLAAVDGRRLA